MGKRALLYIRVSTQEQAEKGYSVEGQKDELISAVEAQDYEVAKVIVDAGYSRDTLDRPGIDEMLDLVVAGGIDAVWAWRRDRYGSSPHPEILASQLRGCANRLATFYTWQFSERSGCRFIGCRYIRYSPIGAASK